jgi:hypothetical protein
MASSPALGDEAEQGFRLSPDQWEIIESHWIDHDTVTIKLSDMFIPSDGGCLHFGMTVLAILRQGYDFVYVVPDENNWVPTSQNPIDLDWAKCLADEGCDGEDLPSASTFDPGYDPDPFDTHYPPPPRPVVVEKKSSGGGCFIQSIQ